MTKKRSSVVTEPEWNQQDLEWRLCHALDIAKQVVERLALNGYIDSADPGNNLRPEKLISETALLLFAASSAASHDTVKARIKTLAQMLIPHARSERMLLGVCLQPALAWDYAQAHVFLSRLGYQDAAFDQLLQQSADSQAKDGCERVPYRMLEQEWVRSNWNPSASRSRKLTRTSASNSVLNRSMDLLNGSREDIYAFTHALVYVTDFNVQPRRLPRSRSVILAEAEAALARCLEEQDYDLGGEVLLAWPLTCKSWSAAAAFGFRVLAGVEDKAGFLPAPNTRLQRLSELQGDDRTKYLLATAYHTAYVMGLLSAAALQPERTPPAQIPTSGAIDGSANKILAFFDAGAHRAHWLDELYKLKDAERDAVAGLLLTIVLRLNIKRREFGIVRKLLEVGYSMGLANSPVSSQAAEMLERLSIYTQVARARRSENQEEPGGAPPPSVALGPEARQN
ncbi:MAG TPA: hypothetical protein VKB49_23880 [Candidatus Sulfotelmatobacter sp.]|nr:hypothetical protein [Candidatus Sulfotelmatobacter sp.]